MNYLGLTTNQILNTIHRLGIFTGETKGKDLDVICPFHNDTHFGNAKIHIESSEFHCFSCGETGNLIKLTYKILGLTEYKQVLEFIGVTDYGMFQSKLLSRQDNKEFHEIIKQSSTQDSVIALETESININESYLQKRGFTQECIDYFNIKKATKCRLRSKKNKEINLDDWMITPITNKLINLNTFEARKLDRVEGVKELFKTAYPLGSNPNRTILNIENVPLDADLILCEGIGGLGRLFTSFGKNRIGALFGASLTPMQAALLNKRTGKNILVPDLDEASSKLMWKMAKEVYNSYVIPITTNDEDDKIMDELKREPIKSSLYLIQQADLFRRRELVCGQ